MLSQQRNFPDFLSLGRWSSALAPSFPVSAGPSNLGPSLPAPFPTFGSGRDSDASVPPVGSGISSAPALPPVNPVRGVRLSAAANKLWRAFGCALAPRRTEVLVLVFEEESPWKGKPRIPFEVG